MHKYIPGPWIPSTTAHGEPGISILSQDRTSDGGWVRWEIARVGLNSRLITPETKATAALIAAAPELLNALKRMAGFHQSEIDGNPDHRYTLDAQREIEAVLVLCSKLEGN
jgi:hypothetical protein